MAHYFLGAVLYNLGEFTLARAHLEQALTLYDLQQCRVSLLHDYGVAACSMVAFTQWALGYPAQARQRIEEALTLAQELAHPFSLSFALFCAATLHQWCQERHATQEQAEACFLKAVEIARKQQAKSLELRVVMSLSRLWQRRGKRKEAHKLLAEIYGWFTEGFDTADLQEARKLLERLA